MKQLLIVLTFVLALPLTSVAQLKLVGKVAEVVDGKTFVLETNAGNTTAQLQYIDVPEPEQSLHKTVSEHLRTLAIGKVAEFHAVSMLGTKLVGRLTVDGVDISLQMLRDGAAWLVPYQRSGQPQSEFTVYREYEILAKNDRLGVWSVQGLKPAWLLREQKQKELARLEAQNPKFQAKLNITSQFQTISRPYEQPTGGKLPIQDKDGWLDTMAFADNASTGVINYNDPNGRFRAFYTSVAFVNLASGNIKQRLECRALFTDFLLPDGSHETMYMIGFRAISDDYNFSKRTSRLTIVADGKSMSMALLGGLRGRATFGAEEMMFYPVSIATLKKIGAAKSVTVKIDRLNGPMDRNLQSLIGQLAIGT
jgi:endonuclease YncB( thermonuclease family)